MINANVLRIYKGPSPQATEPAVVFSIAKFTMMPADLHRKVAFYRERFGTWFDAKTDEQANAAFSTCHFLAIWTRSALNEFRGCIETGVAVEAGDEYRVILGYHNANLTIQAFNFSIYLFNQIEKLDNDELDDLLKKFWALCHRFHPDYQAKILIEYARNNDIPYRPFMEGSKFWQYGWGERSEVFCESSSTEDSSIGAKWSHDKNISKELFRSLGAPVAPSRTLTNKADLSAATLEIGFPCVIKPLDGAQSKGATAHVTDISGAEVAFEYAQKYSNRGVLLERHIPGDDYRIMIVRGKHWRTIQRTAPSVEGDGAHTILQLIEMRNERIRPTIRPGSHHGPIPIDDILFRTLHDQKLHLNQIPATGEKVRLRYIPFPIEGSVNHDVTALVHFDITMLAESLARIFNIALCGIDYRTPDISRSCFECGGFLEINSMPGLMAPVNCGIDASEVGRAILGDHPARIPSALIVASEKNHQDIIKNFRPDPSHGWVCGNRSGIGTTEFPVEERTIDKLTDRILRNRMVKKISILLSPTSLTSNGLPLDKVYLTALHQEAELGTDWVTLLERHSHNFVRTDNIELLGRRFAEFC